MAPPSSKITKKEKPSKMEKPEKPIEKPIMKKRKKKHHNNFAIYIYKVLKAVTEGKTKISRKSMMIMNNFVLDMLENFAAEASRLLGHGKKTTLSSREIQTAVKLLVPKELAEHANLDGVRAVTRFHQSQQVSKAK